MLQEPEDDFMESPSARQSVKGKDRLKKRLKRIQPVEPTSKSLLSAVEECVADSLDELEKEFEIRKSVAVNHNEIFDNAGPTTSTVTYAEVTRSVVGDEFDSLDNAGPSNSTITCPRCLTDMTYYTLSQRQDHVNECLDASQPKESSSESLSLDQLAFCPCCALPWKDKHLEHLKVCASSHSMNYKIILQDLGLPMDSALFQEADDFIPRKHKKVIKAPGTKEDKKDEHLQLALALSESLKEESLMDVEQRIEKACQLRSGPPVLFYSKILSHTKHIITVNSRRKNKNVQLESCLVSPSESHALIQDKLRTETSSTLFEQSQLFTWSPSHGQGSNNKSESEQALAEIHQDYQRACSAAERKLYQEMEQLKKKHEGHLAQLLTERNQRITCLLNGTPFKRQEEPQIHPMTEEDLLMHDILESVSHTQSKEVTHDG